MIVYLCDRADWHKVSKVDGLKNRMGDILPLPRWMLFLSPQMHSCTGGSFCGARHTWNWKTSASLNSFCAQEIQLLPLPGVKTVLLALVWKEDTDSSAEVASNRLVLWAMERLATLAMLQWRPLSAW